MKKYLVILSIGLAVLTLTSCNEAPQATLTEETTENIITENIITETIEEENTNTLQCDICGTTWTNNGTRMEIPTFDEDGRFIKYVNVCKECFDAH